MAVVRKLRKTDIQASSGFAVEAEVLERATEVMGTKGAAMRWMGTPVRALDYATPISLIHTPKGRIDVLQVLGRLEHGVL